MPFINVKLIEDVFTADQKRQVVERLTDAMVSIEGENMRSVTWVVVEEVRSGNWGIGGQPMTTADVKALASGKPAEKAPGQAQAPYQNGHATEPVRATPPDLRESVRG